jgi:hypothetical protein
MPLERGMPAISITQPHAWLLGKGKNYETREWFPPNRYRGPIAIHATKSGDELAGLTLRIGGLKMAGEWPPREPGFMLSLYEVLCEYPIPLAKIPTGAIVATARLTNVYDAAALYPKLKGAAKYFGDFGKGRYAWEIKDVVPLDKPIPCRGNKGLWEWKP